MIKPDWQAFVVNPAPRVEVFISLYSSTMFTPPILVMHESPAVLWAREGNLGTANIGFDLCKAKHFIPWLRFTASVKLNLCVPALNVCIHVLGFDCNVAVKLTTLQPLCSLVMQWPSTVDLLKVLLSIRSGSVVVEP